MFSNFTHISCKNNEEIKPGRLNNVKQILTESRGIFSSLHKDGWCWEIKPNPDTDFFNPPRNVYQTHLLPGALPASVQISSIYHHSPTSLHLCSINHPPSFPKFQGDCHDISLTSPSPIFLLPHHLRKETLVIRVKSK